jgi:hypothetical protein
MRYYPKRGFGIELSYFDTSKLEDFQQKLDELREADETEALDELEESGPEGPWNSEVLTAISEWSGDHYDDFIFEEMDSCHSVTPMWIGNLPDERGGEITGVQGFDTSTEYLIFNPREQDKESWDEFKSHLEQHGIPLVEGSWSQLG